ITSRSLRHPRPTLFPYTTLFRSRGSKGATQTKLDFIPEHHTDFVFSVVGEEFGFVGAAVVLSLYALLIWRGLRILTMAKNLYGRSEEHTSELQSRGHLVCRLLLE